MDGWELHVGDFGNNVGTAAEHLKELRDIDKFIKTLLLPEALAGRLYFKDVPHLSELRRPCIKTRQAELLQHVILQILLHDEHFRHAVHDRRCGCKHDAAPTIELLQPAYLHIQVKGALTSVAGAKSGDVVHIGGIKQVLVIVRFIHKQAVNTELLKVDIV